MQVDDELLSLTSGPVLRRRGFMLGSLAGGFATLVAPTGQLLAQTISTPIDGLDAGIAQVPVGAEHIPCYWAKPSGRTGLPTVLVVQEIFGVHEHIRDVCRRFAQLGYMAVAPELYIRRGDASKESSIQALIQNIVSKVPDKQVLADLDATLVWAAAAGGDADNAGITGFCWGGRIVWMYSAHRPGLKAGVAWYGRLVSAETANTPSHPIDVATTLHAPVLGLYGGADAGIPAETIARMKDKLSGGGEASRASSFHVYPDAPHAFHADYRPSYRQDAARDGWQRCLAWFRDHGLS